MTKEVHAPDKEVHAPEKEVPAPDKEDLAGDLKNLAQKLAAFQKSPEDPALRNDALVFTTAVIAKLAITKVS